MVDDTDICQEIGFVKHRLFRNCISEVKCNLKKVSHTIIMLICNTFSCEKIR